jgi:DNA replication protein DnaC
LDTAEVQSIQESVRNLLQNNKFNEARSLSREHRTIDFIDIFKAFPPKPEKCPDCGEEYEQRFDEYFPKWQKSIRCLKCLKISLNKEILEKHKEYMQARGIPKRFLDVSTDDCPDEYKASGQGLFLFGECGVGKTHVMAAIMKHIILNTPLIKEKMHTNEYGENHFTNYHKPSMKKYPLFISVPDLLLKIRNTYNKNDYDINNHDNTEQKIINKYSSVDVLLLDDLGTEKPTEWALQTLYLIIDHRYRELKKTIITSNFDLNGISDRLSNRIASRIVEMCDVVNMTGKNRRIKSGERKT